MKYHIHHCPHCNKEFSCVYKKCEGESFLWDSECKASATIRNHWSEIRQLGHTSISLEPKPSKKRIQFEKVRKVSA